MEVKKGVIAAAGRGTRFLPVTKGYPKELVPILSKPNIQLLVEEMIGAGVEEIAIVHRPENHRLQEYFRPDEELEKFLRENDKEDFIDSLRAIWNKADLHFIPQGKDLPYGNASPIIAAREFIAEKPFVYMFGDDFVVEDEAGHYLTRLIEVYEQYQPAVVLGAQEVPPEEINRYGSIEYVEDENYPNRAIKVLEKLPANQAPSNVAQFGRFVVDPKVFAVLKDQEMSRDNELWFADTNNILAEQDVVIAEPIKSGFWLTTGDPLRWLKANITVALRDPEISQPLKEFLKELED